MNRRVWSQYDLCLFTLFGFFTLGLLAWHSLQGEINESKSFWPNPEFDELLSAFAGFCSFWLPLIWWFSLSLCLSLRYVLFSLPKYSCSSTPEWAGLAGCDCLDWRRNSLCRMLLPLETETLALASPWWSTLVEFRATEQNSNSVSWLVALVGFFFCCSWMHTRLANESESMELSLVAASLEIFRIRFAIALCVALSRFDAQTLYLYRDFFFFWMHPFFCLLCLILSSWTLAYKKHFVLGRRYT